MIEPALIDNIPQELKDLSRWVDWTYEDRGGPKPTKPPINAKTGEYADCKRPETWTDFWKALAATARLKERKIQGIGIVLDGSDNLIGVDLDNCRDPLTGTIEQQALEIIHLINSYTEVSPSGKGIRIMVRGKLPVGRRKNGNFEAYGKERYVTITGNHLSGTPLTIETRNGELTEFHKRFLEQNSNTEHTIPKFQVDRNSWVIPESEKRHDEILRMVARWKRNGVPRTEALIFAARVAEINNTPGRRQLTSSEIEREIDYVYSRQDPLPNGFEPPTHWKRLDAAEVTNWNVTPLRPLVAGIIALATFVLIAAQSQTGKTLFGLYLAAKLIVGGLLFELFEITPVKKVVYFVLEDPERRIQRRLLDYYDTGALPPESLIVFYTPGLTVIDDSYNYFRTTLEQEKPDVVFIDTYQKATPGVNSWDDEKQGPILHKLSNITRELNVTLVIVDHIRKSDNSGRKTHLTIDDVKGSGAKAQNADTVILMDKSGDELKFQAFSKDFDKPVGILLRVAPEGSQEPKYSFISDISTEAGKKKGEATRQRILDSIPFDEWITASGIAGKLKLGQSTVTLHLRKLQEGQELIESRGSNKFREYRRIATEYRSL